MIDFLTKSIWPLIITAILYSCMAIGYYRINRYGMMIAFIAYAIANLGFIVDWYIKSNN